MTSDAAPKHCPRCRGFMIASDDRYGEFSSCITCGYEYDAPFPDPKGILEEVRLAAGNVVRPSPSHGKLRL